MKCKSFRELLLFKFILLAKLCFRYSLIYICAYVKGLDALLLVGLDSTQNLTEFWEIEFGRGFGYNEPLSVGFADIANILQRNLVSPSVI